MFAHTGAHMVKEVPRSERQLALAEAQRAFLDDAVRHSGLSLTQIARSGKLNPSTLTRFRNATTHTGLLSTATLAAVAELTGIPVPAGIPAAPAGTRARGLREPEAEPYFASEGSRMAALVAAITGNATHLVPWEMRSNALELEHILAGDVVILDMNAEPRAGDIVCAQIYDWANPANTQTVWRVYEAPFLLSASADRNQRKPRLVDGENVAIKGVVQEVLRPAR